MMDPAVDCTFATGPVIPLWEKGKTPGFVEEYGQREPSLVPYLLTGKPDTGAVIVCPGGAYVNKAPHEAEPIARRLNELGLHAFVLDYRVAPYRHPAPLMDAQRAVRVARYHAAALGIRGDKIAILGFSAGGHLSGTAATLYDGGDPQAADPIDRVSSRPDAAVLCYAVLNFTAYMHSGSMGNLLGEAAQYTPEKLRELTLRLTPELNVTADTPPTFLWHTTQDQSVPVMNSITMAGALALRGVTTALHVYPFGRHGIGLGEDNRQASRWPQEAAGFLREIGFHSQST